MDNSEGILTAFTIIAVVLIICLTVIKVQLSKHEMMKIRPVYQYHAKEYTLVEVEKE